MKNVKTISDVLSLAQKYHIEYTEFTPTRHIIFRVCRKKYPAAEWRQQAEALTELLLREGER